MSGSKQDYINYRIEKSLETYQDAVLLAHNERWNSCINRLYYSSFYLVSALVYQHNLKAETHNGTKIQFFLKFIKTEKINRKFGKFYSHLFDWRQEADYADFKEFDRETVITSLTKQKNLMKQYQI